MQRYEVGGMHVHRRFLGSLAAAALAALGAQARPVQAQTIPSTRWVISSLHPDPTPPLGAPDCEYIALYAMSDSLTGGGACRTDGLVLSWNGHERELPDGAWPAGPRSPGLPCLTKPAVWPFDCPRRGPNPWTRSPGTLRCGGPGGGRKPDGPGFEGVQNPRIGPPPQMGGRQVKSVIPSLWVVPVTMLPFPLWSGSTECQRCVGGFPRRGMASFFAWSVGLTERWSIPKVWTWPNSRVNGHGQEWIPAEIPIRLEH